MPRTPPVIPQRLYCWRLPDLWSKFSMSFPCVYTPSTYGFGIKFQVLSAYDTVPFHSWRLCATITNHSKVISTLPEFAETNPDNDISFYHQSPRGMHRLYSLKRNRDGDLVCATYYKTLIFTYADAKIWKIKAASPWTITTDRWYGDDHLLGVGAH